MMMIDCSVFLRQRLLDIYIRAQALFCQISLSLPQKCLLPLMLFAFYSILRLIDGYFDAYWLPHIARFLKHIASYFNVSS